MKTKKEEGEAICQICKKVYETADETQDVAESGEHFCPDCWNDKE